MADPRGGSADGRRATAGGARGEAPLPAARALVLALAVLANLPTLFVGFVMDDHPIVERDARVVEGRVLEPWTTSYWNTPQERGEYRPLVLSSYALERKLLGPAAWHFHLLNLILHGLVSLAVLTAARAIGLGERAAVAAAVLFAVHPVHVDAIAPVVGRAELLAAVGFVVPLAVWMRIRRAAAPRAAPLLALAGCVAVGVFSKESALAVVPLLGVAELLLLRGRGRRTLAAASLAVGGVVLVYLFARATVLGGLLPVEGEGTILALENPLVDESLGVRWLTAASILGSYLRLFAWPSRLSPDYTYDSLPVIGDALDVRVALPLVALAVLLFFALRSLRTRPQIAIAAVAFLAPYAIVSNVAFPIGTMLAERLLYLPSVGLCWLAGLALAAAAERLRGPRSARGRLFAVAGPLALALAVACFARADAWRDEAGLYRAAAEHYPRNFLLQRNLGSLAMEAGRYAEALYRMQRVTELAPGYAKGWGDRGFLHLATGDPAAAAEALETSVELDPRQLVVLKNLAEAYRALGRFLESGQIDARALALQQELAAP